MGHARIVETEHVVHFLGGQRNRRRVEPDFLSALVLHQRARIAGVGFQVQHAAGVGIEHRVALDVVEGRQAHHRAEAFRQFLLHARQLAIEMNFTTCRRLVLRFRCANGFIDDRVGIDRVFHAPRLVDIGGIDHGPVGWQILDEKCRAANVGDVVDGLTVGEPVGQFHQRALGIAVEQHVGLGVGEDGAAHLVLPVVVVGDAAQ